jgi:hypothetical protein
MTAEERAVLRLTNRRINASVAPWLRTKLKT